MNKEWFKKLYNSKLVKSGIWYTVGTFFVQGLSFLTVPIFTRLLTTSDFGMVTVYGNWLSIFTVLVSLGLVSAVYTGRVDFKETYDEFTSSILFLATISVSIWIGIGLLFTKQIASIINMNTNLVLILIIQCFFAFVVDFSNAKLNAQYKYKSYLFISISTAMLNILLSIILISQLKTDRYYGRIHGGAIVTTIYGITLYGLTTWKGKKFIDKKYWKYALAISLPLILHSLSGVILTSIDTVMIQRKVGENAAGVYSFAYKIGMILNIIWIACNKAWVPWFFESMKEERYKDIEKKIKYYIALFSIISFLLIFVSPEIGKVMGTKAYLAGLNYVPLIMMGYYFVFLYSIPSNLEFYTKKTQYISMGTMMAAVVNLVLNYIFIPRYGAVAAAWTTLISYALLFIYHYSISLYVTPIRIFKIRYFIYGSLFIGGSSGVFVMLKEQWIIRYIVVILVLGVTLVNVKRRIKK